MKKFNLTFLLPIVGVFLLGLFSGCTFHADKAFETVQLKLPQWPPNDGFSENYPPLSKWKIEIRSAEDCKTYFTNQETIELSVKRHTPFCTLAYPITLTQDNYQTQYFMPAGFIYPWNYKADDAKFEWEKGIAASLMAKIFLSKIETGISTQKLNKFIGTFNWQKACETMLKTEHNPWFLESEKFLHDLCNLNFKASQLNTKSCISYDLSELNKTFETSFLSSYIPENQKIKEHSKISLKKNKQVLLYNGKETAIIITYESAKNVSLEIIFLPIYIEDI